MVPVSTRAGKLTVVTVETLSPLVRATVAPSPAPAEGQHLTCLWAPQGVGALDLPANPNVAPVVAVSVQCKDKRPCPSDGQDEKTVDEPVLLGEDIAYDVTCWLDLDGDSAFSEGDKWGHHEVDEVDAAFVLDEVKSAAEDEADTGEGD